MVFEATPDIHLHNPLETVHGGFAATMLDFACGYAMLSKDGSGPEFLDPGNQGRVSQDNDQGHGDGPCGGKIVTFGRRATYTESRLTDLDEKLYISATSSLIVLSA